MKITKSYLNKLIKEEYSKILSEGIGPGGSFIGRNASAGRRHPGGYNKFRYTDAQIDLNRMIKSEEFLKQSDFQKLTLLNDFVLKHESDENEKEVVNKAKEALEDVVKRIQRSGSPIGKIVNWLGDKGKKLALDLDGIFEEETTRTKKNIKENSVKITKIYLNKLIKEELSHLEEAEETVMGKYKHKSGSKESALYTLYNLKTFIEKDLMPKFSGVYMKKIEPAPEKESNAVQITFGDEASKDQFDKNLQSIGLEKVAQMSKER